VRDVVILGVGLIKFGRYPEKTVIDLASEACLNAIDDAGVSMKDVQFFASGNIYQASAMVGQRILKEIGQVGVPVVNVANACATGSTAFRMAYLAVASGQYDIAMAVGSEQMGKAGLLGAGGGGGGGGGGRVGGFDPAYITEGVLGSGTMPTVFSHTGIEHMRRYGSTPEHFVKVAYKNHKNSVHTPYAQYQKAFTMEEIANSRMISWPNTLLMCCPTGDGAAAAVLASADKARQFTTHPIKVAASVLTSDPYTEHDLAMFDVNTLTRNAAQEAYKLAGITPKDLDVVELHDCFATAELAHYENLGLCPEGEAHHWLDEGKFDIGGQIPVNASGGLISRGHPLGATGVCGISEVSWQLRGQAGGRQVQGAKIGLAHVIGLGSACTVHVLQK
jgi:acetyl-CoA acyltransferase